MALNEDRVFDNLSAHCVAFGEREKISASASGGTNSPNNRLFLKGAGLFNLFSSDELFNVFQT